MPAILFVSSFHPSAIGHIGAGEAICGDTLNKYLDTGYHVDVVVISPVHQRANEKIVQRCNSYETFNTNALGTIDAILKNLHHGSLWAPWFFTRVYPKLIKLLNNKIASKHYDFVWLDFPSTLGFATTLSHTDIRYCAHDIVAQRISRSVTKKILSQIVWQVESRLINKLSRISVLSDKDLLLVRNMGFERDVDMISLGTQKVGLVDNSIDIKTVVSQFEDKKNIVFFGNMHRSENHWSIVWFIIFVFSRLVLRDRTIQLWVLGLSPRFSLRLLSKFITNVHIVGAVDDPTLAFKKSTLCIAPLLFGAGVKIKVIQMLDAEASVLATPVGSEGINNNSKLYVVSPKEFYSELLKLLG